MLDGFMGMMLTSVLPHHGLRRRFLPNRFLLRLGDNALVQECGQFLRRYLFGEKRENHEERTRHHETCAQAPLVECICRHNRTPQMSIARHRLAAATASPKRIGTPTSRRALLYSENCDVWHLSPT